MTHGILIPNAIAAKNIDSYNRSAICTSALDNGWLVLPTGKSSTAGHAEVWTVIEPTSSGRAGLTGLWMVYSGDEVVVTNAQYKGLDPDPRNFYTVANKVVSIFKPEIGDIITVTEDCVTGTIGANTFVNATDTTGGFKPVWGTLQTASVFSMKLLATTYISIGSGAIDTQRVTAYQFEVVGL